MNLYLIRNANDPAMYDLADQAKWSGGVRYNVYATIMAEDLFLHDAMLKLLQDSGRAGVPISIIARDE